MEDDTAVYQSLSDSWQVWTADCGDCYDSGTLAGQAQYELLGVFLSTQTTAGPSKYSYMISLGERDE